MKDLSHIYNHLYSNNYGVSGRFKFVEKYLNKYGKPGRRVLDVGCGLGRYVKRLTDLGYAAIGVDIIDPELTEIQSQYVQIKGYDYCSADYITSTDVLEHLPPKEVPLMLKAMCENCSYAFLTISHSKAHHKGPNGEQLHLTIEPPEWWFDQMRKVGMKILEQNYVRDYNLTAVVARGKLDV